MHTGHFLPCQSREAVPLSWHRLSLDFCMAGFVHLHPTEKRYLGGFIYAAGSHFIVTFIIALFLSGTEDVYKRQGYLLSPRPDPQNF